MIQKPSYPFYNSLRFRFGLLFNVLFLLLLSGVLYLLYQNVKHDLQQSFVLRLSTGANAVLQKTEVNPVTVPLPQSDESFLLLYNNSLRVDTLFNNLGAITINTKAFTNSLHQNVNWWCFTSHKTLETGGVITVVYVLSADGYNASLYRLQQLLFIYVPAALLLSFIAGYLLSGILLKPLQKIIAKANSTDLTNNIKLLDSPPVTDELHQLTDALNRMLMRIEKQAAQQNAFFASASHELRTPLSNMLTELQTISQFNAREDVQAVMQHQIDEVKRLSKIVNDFLLMSQLKADSLSVHKQQCNVTELCLEAIERLQPTAMSNHQTIKIELLPPDEEFNVISDASHLSVVFTNLISNAVKYGLKDEVISILMKKDAGFISFIIQNKTHARVEEVANLKNEFIRGAAYEEGFGLGLWITHQLLIKNGGTLHLAFHGNLFSATVLLTSAAD